VTAATFLNEWLQKGALFLELQVGALPLPSTRGVDSRRPLAIVGLDQIAHREDGQPEPSANRACRCRLNQGMADHQPTPDAPGFYGSFEALLNLFDTQVVLNADPLSHPSLAQWSFSKVC
jgi:hypothetical protein